MKRCSACLALFALLSVLPSCRRKPNAYVPPPPPEVTVSHATTRTAPLTLDLTGTTRGIESVEVRARVRGFIQSKGIVDGQRVKKGDLLFVIDPRPFEAVVLQNQAQVDAKKADLKLTEITLSRTKEALQQSGANQIEVDRAQAERDATNALLQLAQAQLTQAKLDLEFTQVVAPMDGRVGITGIEVGQLVGASEPTLLCVVINDSTMLATYFISERDLIQMRRAHQFRRPKEDGRANVRVGMAITDESDYRHEGWYKWGDNTINPDTGTFKVEAEFDNKAGTILPGLFVRVRNYIGEQTVLLVPDVAVQRDQQGAFLFVLDKDDKVMRRNVRLGDVVERQRMIVAGPDEDYGITTSDRIIINGLQRARPGGAVKPVEVPPAMVSAPPSAPASPAAPSAPAPDAPAAPAPTPATAPAPAN